VLTRQSRPVTSRSPAALMVHDLQPACSLLWTLPQWKAPATLSVRSSANLRASVSTEIFAAGQLQREMCAGLTDLAERSFNAQRLDAVAREGEAPGQVSSPSREIAFQTALQHKFDRPKLLGLENRRSVLIL
jgi:hypothetical protein